MRFCEGGSGHAWLHPCLWIKFQQMSLRNGFEMTAEHFPGSSHSVQALSLMAADCYYRYVDTTLDLVTVLSVGLFPQLPSRSQESVPVEIHPGLTSHLPAPSHLFTCFMSPRMPAMLPGVFYSTWTPALQPLSEPTALTSFHLGLLLIKKLLHCPWSNFGSSNADRPFSSPASPSSSPAYKASLAYIFVVEKRQHIENHKTDSNTSCLRTTIKVTKYCTGLGMSHGAYVTLTNPVNCSVPKLCD